MIPFEVRGEQPRLQDPAAPEAGLSLRPRLARDGPGLCTRQCVGNHRPGVASADSREHCGAFQPTWEPRQPVLEVHEEGHWGFLLLLAHCPHCAVHAFQVPCPVPHGRASGVFTARVQGRRRVGADVLPMRGEEAVYAGSW